MILDGDRVVCVCVLYERWTQYECSSIDLNNTIGTLTRQERQLAIAVLVERGVTKTSRIFDVRSGILVPLDAFKEELAVAVFKASSAG